MNSFIFPFPPKSKKTQHKIKEKYHPDATVLAILLADVVVPILAAASSGRGGGTGIKDDGEVTGNRIR